MGLIRPLKFVEYQTLANTFLKKVGMYENKTVPLNIDLLIEKAGHEIVPIGNLQKDFGVKGVVIKTIDGFDIGIDLDHYMSDKQETLFAFTLAEEMAHILAHSYLFDNVTSYQESANIINSLSDEDYSMQEQQARNIASCLLLPSHIFDKFVIEYISKNIDAIKKRFFYSQDDLSDYLSTQLEKTLNLSRFVINLVILKRYPNLLIEQILNHFGRDIIS